MSTLDSDIRVSTWNCEGGFRSKKKIVSFSTLQADIAVLQEVLEKDIWDFPGASTPLWIGPPGGKKGIAVLGFNGWIIEAGPPCTEQWFLPVIASRGNTRLRVLALWVKPEKSSYIPSAMRALKSLTDFLSEPATVVIGDFNANISWEGTRSASQYGFRAQLELLRQSGFTSVWHHVRDEQHGSESAGTRYGERREAKPFHVDYAFVSSDLLPSITNVTLGTFQEWAGAAVSDHVPLSFDLCTVPQRGAERSQVRGTSKPISTCSGSTGLG